MLPTAYRLPLFLVAAWLSFLGIFLVEVKPQLELDRMLVILSLVSCIPAAKAIEQLMQSVIDSATHREDKLKFIRYPLAAFTFSFLVAAPVSATSTIRNRSLYKASFQTNFTQELNSLMTRYQDSGRVLFSGCIIHEMDGGHLAPFTELSGSSIIASSPVHNLWWYTQIFPDEYLSLIHI